MQGVRADEQVLADDRVQHDLNQYRTEEEHAALAQLVDHVVLRGHQGSAQLYGEVRMRDHLVEEHGWEGEREGERPDDGDGEQDTTPATQEVSFYGADDGDVPDETQARNTIVKQPLRNQ